MVLTFIHDGFRDLPKLRNVLFHFAAVVHSSECSAIKRTWKAFLPLREMQCVVFWRKNMKTQQGIFCYSRKLQKLMVGRPSCLWLGWNSLFVHKIKFSYARQESVCDVERGNHSVNDLVSPLIVILKRWVRKALQNGIGVLMKNWKNAMTTKVITWNPGGRHCVKPRLEHRS